MNTSPSRTAASILAQIRRLQSTPADDDVPKEARESYHQAAAVIAVIDEPDHLRPLDPQWARFAPTIIASDLVPAGPGRRPSARILRHELRRTSLKDLASNERMTAALQANPKERTGLVQTQFERYLTGAAQPIDEQSHAELEGSLQALTWLDGIADGLPDIDAVRARIAFLDMIGPFETLAGDDVFRGRRNELDELRSYVGVLSPQTLRKRLLDRLPWGKPDPLAALSVSGPGGVGKSALIARFMLEHWRMPSEIRVPFAYLDFERPTLNIAEPTTLLDEMLQQLVHQFPEYAEFQTLRTSYSRRLSEIDSDASRASGSGRTSLAQSVFADLLSLLEATLGPRPYLIVLDTFELVQYRGESHAFPLWDLLVEMQATRPFLRVVISGRAPAITLRLAGKPPASLVLGELDRDSAVALVRAMGIVDESFAGTIVRQVGGVPLSLKLAVALVKRQPDADISVKSLLWLRAADEVVQGQLFDRILGQIDSPELKRLAHPGLVLRRLTPEAIFYILREPCNLALRTLADASALFELLKQEISLVSTDESDGALLHRRDLRAVMLKLLLHKEPVVAADVSARAVQWYATQSGKRARAEEAYHRLLLGQHIERKDAVDPDVRASLQIYIAELPLQSQRLLATYGLRVDPEILERATREEKEASLAEQVEQLLPHRSGLQVGLSLLREYKKPKGDSPLWRSWSRLLIEQRQDDAAFADVERGLIEATAARNNERTYDLLCEKAWLCEVAERETELDETLDMLERYVDRMNDLLGRLQYSMQRARSNGDFRAPSLDSVWTASVLEWFGQASPRDLFALMPATRGFWTALAAADVVDLSSIVRLIVDIESPFGSTTFEDDTSMSVLQHTVRTAYTASGEVRTESYRALATSLEQLAGAWPYRNLRVHAPESHRSYLDDASALSR